MTVGGSDRIDTFLMSVSNHLEEFRIDIRFALKIKNEADQLLVHFINHLSEKILFHVSGLSGEGPEPTRTFRAPEIARRSGFNGNSHRGTPLNRFAGQPGQLVRKQDRPEIEQFKQSAL